MPPPLPAPPIGYAEIPGEIDASQYDPAHFPPRFEQIPEEGAPLPARDSLMVDAPYAPIERPADEIPDPVTLVQNWSGYGDHGARRQHRQDHPGRRGRLPLREDAA